MDLKLIKKRKVHDIAIIKKFEYGPFEIKVTIDLNGPIDINATDRLQEIAIKAINDEKAIMSIGGVYLSNAEKIDEFIKKCNIAKELLFIINENRQELIRKEDC